MNGFTSESHDPANKRRGFTLIELIVIVGMLAMLIALLVPALTKAQRQARAVTCLTNLRDLHAAFASYISTSGDIAFDPTHKAYWLTVLKPHLPESSSALMCPEATNPSYGLGDARSAWGPFDERHGSPQSISYIGQNSSSFGFNGWLYETADWVLPHDLTHLGAMIDRVPTFGDANFIEGFPRIDDPYPRNVARGSNIDEPQMGRFCIARHGESINAAFLDGHAEQVPLSQLCYLQWLSRKSIEPLSDASLNAPTILPSR